MNVRFPAAKAVSNLLTLDCVEIVDRLLYHGVIDHMLNMAMSELATNQVLVEVAFAFSNITAGTD